MDLFEEEMGKDRIYNGILSSSLISASVCTDRNDYHSCSRERVRGRKKARMLVDIELGPHQA